MFRAYSRQNHLSETEVTERCVARTASSVWWLGFSQTSRGRYSSRSDRLTVRGHFDIDVSPGRPGVGADFVGGGDDLLRLLGVGDRRQGDVEADPDVETTVIGSLQVDFGIDSDLAQVDLLAPGDRAQRAPEAGGVADREELLGVGARLDRRRAGRCRLRVRRQKFGRFRRGALRRRVLQPCRSLCQPSGTFPLELAQRYFDSPMNRVRAS